MSWRCQCTWTFSLDIAGSAHSDGAHGFGHDTLCAQISLWVSIVEDHIFTYSLPNLVDFWKAEEMDSAVSIAQWFNAKIFVSGVATLAIPRHQIQQSWQFFFFWSLLLSHASGFPSCCFLQPAKYASFNRRLEDAEAASNEFASRFILTTGFPECFQTSPRLFDAERSDGDVAQCSYLRNLSQ